MPATKRCRTKPLAPSGTDSRPTAGSAPRASNPSASTSLTTRSISPVSGPAMTPPTNQSAPNRVIWTPQPLWGRVRHPDPFRAPTPSRKPETPPPPNNPPSTSSNATRRLGRPRLPKLHHLRQLPPHRGRRRRRHPLRRLRRIRSRPYLTNLVRPHQNARRYQHRPWQPALCSLARRSHRFSFIGDQLPNHAPAAIPASTTPMIPVHVSSMTPT
jgi:hypothetical protein